MSRTRSARIRCCDFSKGANIIKNINNDDDNDDNKNRLFSIPGDGIE